MWPGTQDKKGAVSSSNLRDLRESPVASPFIIKLHKANKVIGLLCFLSGHKPLLLWIFPHISNPGQLCYVLLDKPCLQWWPKHFEKSAVSEKAQIITENRLYKGFTQPFSPSLWYLTAIAADQRTRADKTKDVQDVYIWAVYLYQNRRFHKSEAPKPNGSTAPFLTFTEFPRQLWNKKRQINKRLWGVL